MGASCGPFGDPSLVQNRVDVAAGPIGGNATVGEDFTAGCNGLTSISVQVAAYPDVTARDGKLALVLTDLAGSSPGPAAAETFDERTLAANEWVSLVFPPIASSRGRVFRLAATTTSPSPAPFTLWASNHLESPNFRRFENGTFRPGALAFRAACDVPMDAIASASVASIAANGLLWPIELALCLLPGLAIVVLTTRERDVTALLGYSAGWSVLVAPSALAIASPLALGAIVGPVLLSFAVLGIGIWIAGRRLASKRLSEDPSNDATTGARAAEVPRFQVTGSVLIAILGALGAAIVRVAIARDLVLPLWVDSIQHSYIVNLILDTGRIPVTYGSAMPTEPFDYHFGFHALAAFGASLAGSSAPSAVLATGQILGFLVPLAVYSLGRDLLNCSKAAAVAALLVGLVTTQPTYYVTWGRYPELAGLVALPAAFVALRAVLEQSPTRLMLGQAVVAAASMPLVHPRVTIFLAALIVSWLVVDARNGLRPAARSGLRLLLVALVAGALISPWILRQIGAHGAQLAIQASAGGIDFPLGLATAGNDRWVLGLGLIGLGFAAIRRPDILAIVVLWGALVLLAANPASFGIPLETWVNNGSVAIALFVPGTVFAGYAIARLADLARYDRWPGIARHVAGAALVVAAFTQLPSLLTVVNPCCYLAAPADVRAMAWIDRNTPADARFVVNGYRWSGSAWAGSDAGYWIPVLARRATTLPPLFYFLGPRDAARNVEQTAIEVEVNGSDPERLAALARLVGANYIFVGTGGGPIDPFALAADSAVQVVYREGGAWIFEILPAAGVGKGSTSLLASLQS